MKKYSDKVQFAALDAEYGLDKLLSALTLQKSPIDPSVMELLKKAQAACMAVFFARK